MLWDCRGLLSPVLGTSHNSQITTHNPEPYHSNLNLFGIGKDYQISINFFKFGWLLAKKIFQNQIYGQIFGDFAQIRGEYIQAIYNFW